MRREPDAAEEEEAVDEQQAQQKTTLQKFANAYYDALWWLLLLHPKINSQKFGFAILIIGSDGQAVVVVVVGVVVVAIVPAESMDVSLVAVGGGAVPGKKHVHKLSAQTQFKNHFIFIEFANFNGPNYSRPPAR